MLTLDQIRDRVDQLAARIAAPAEALPSFGRTADFGRPHIECDSAYHWVVVERGREQERRSTADLDTLLYWAFEAATFDMAMSYATQNSRPAEDFRRQLFRKQRDLLISIDPAWGERCKLEIAAILAKDPFADGGPATLD